MLKKHSILSGVTLSVFLMLIATMVYPGGSIFNYNSIGFNWSENFISNLFEAKAINGSDNASRPWATVGMIFLSISFALFFIDFSKKIPIQNAANVVKYLGAAGMLFTFLIATPLHNIMVIIASILFLVSIFYITVFILKSQLHFLKLLCVLYLLVFYSTLFMYGSSYFREYLAIIQKVLFASTIVLILVLHYFTNTKNFEHLKTNKQKQ
ncbi:MAG: hypothetical protein V4620_05500 [Bacteroidota bacterium]